MKNMTRWIAGGAVGALALLGACRDRTEEPEVRTEEPGTGGGGTAPRPADEGVTGQEEQIPPSETQQPSGPPEEQLPPGEQPSTPEQPGAPEQQEQEQEQLPPEQRPY